MSSADPDLRWVPVFMYHSVVPHPPRNQPYAMALGVDAFERQLRWLSLRGYTGTALSVLESGQAPKRSVVLTFDDGYEDNYLYAFPVLRKYGFSATVFVVTGALDGDNGFDRRFTATEARMLTSAQVHEMHRYGVEFGSHSVNHPASLTDLNDHDLKEEVVRSKHRLEELLNRRVAHFAYPHGKHDDRVEQAVAEAGYALACGTEGSRFSRLCLQRIDATKAGGADVELRWRVRHAKWRAKRLVRAGRQSRFRVGRSS